MTATTPSIGGMLRLFGLAGLTAISAIAGTAPAKAADVLIICASEGQTCYASNGTTTITYGLNGAVITTVGVTQIQCTNDAFHGDPLVGKTKSCTYTVEPEKKNSTQCANEGSRCNFTGAKLVRYGAGANWVYDSFVNGTDCNNGVFGDPAYGSTKSCQVAN